MFYNPRRKTMTPHDSDILNALDQSGKGIPTPYYLLDESRLLKNLKKIARLRELSGAKSVLALKCFSTWSVFDLMKEYMDGTTSSSLFEAKLGHEKFGKEVHAYSVAYSEEEVREVATFATKMIFNSVSQLERFHPLVKGKNIGLRINPNISFSGFDLANPARPFSRLGATQQTEIERVLPLINGIMFHCNCENNQRDKLTDIIEHISNNFAPLLEKVEWVSLGGGIYFTQEGFPLEAFAEKLAAFSKRFNVQVYLEPGETSITQSGYLVTSVLDLVHNQMDIAIVDAAVETHMLDLLIYRTDAKIALPKKGSHR